MRSSTEKGSQDYQIEAIGKCDRIFTDIISGVKSSRPALDELLTFARQGDEVVVYSISRLGRNLRLVLEIVEQFNRKGVKLVSIKEGFDASNPTGRLVMNILASVAELEREQVIERMQDGRKISNKKQGRKPLLQSKKEAVVAMLKSGEMTHTAIMKSVGLSRASFYKLLKEISKSHSQ